MVIFKREYFFIVVLLISIVLSIKPFLFTVNYILANYYIKVMESPEYYSKYVLKAIEYNPDSFEYFKEYIIKSIIICKDKTVLDLINKEKRKKIKLRYKDNFYLQDVLNNLDKNRNWQHLNEISYFFLSNRKYNKLTKLIFRRLNYKFDEKFLFGLCDFLFWQENIELGNFIVEKYSLYNYQYKNPLFME